MVARILSAPVSWRLEGSPNVPRTGSSQTWVSVVLPINAMVADAVQAHVREIRQPVVLRADRDAREELARHRADHVHGRVVTARRPQLRTVRVELQHVRATAAGDDPLADHPAGREVDDRYRSLETVGHVQVARVA